MDHLLDKIMGLRSESVLQVLPFEHLEECKLGPLCSSPDSELRGRSPALTEPGEHL